MNVNETQKVLKVRTIGNHFIYFRYIVGTKTFDDVLMMY